MNQKWIKEDSRYLCVNTINTSISSMVIQSIEVLTNDDDENNTESIEEYNSRVNGS